jgi:hypothetical protein
MGFSLVCRNLPLTWRFMRARPDLDTTTIPGFDKLAGYLIAGDFRSAEVKKIGDNLYRARLDRGNRLLFALYRHGEERCILALEYIHQHAYGTPASSPAALTINEDLIPAIGPEATETAPELPYLNPALHRFPPAGTRSCPSTMTRRRSTAFPPPLVIIGSAGSGKTALTPGKAEGRPGRLPLCDPLALPGPERSRPLLRPRLRETRTRRSSSCPFGNTWRASRSPPGREMTPTGLRRLGVTPTPAQGTEGQSPAVRGNPGGHHWHRRGPALSRSRELPGPGGTPVDLSERTARGGL